MNVSDLISVSSRPYASLLHELLIQGRLFVSKQLSFSMQPQTQTNWCWAATSTSVSHFYWGLSTWTQCKVANSELGHNDCCNSPVPSPCNVAWYLDKALTRTENFVSILTGQASFQQIRAEIDAGRPVGARIGWSGGGGHFMVICGYSQVAGTDYFDIDDPIYGKSHLSVTNFSSNYQGSGTWTHTYFTKSYVKMPIKYWELDDSVIRHIWEVRPLLQMKADLTFSGDISEKIQNKSAALGMAHPVYLLGLDALTKDKRPTPRSAMLRVYEMSGDQINAFFDLGDEPERPLIQMSTSKAHLEPFQQSLEQAIHAIGKSKAECELRMLRVPALNFEAVWVSYDGAAKDFLVPLRTHGKLEAHKALPFNEALSVLKKSAESLGERNDLTGS